ncbi:MAG: SAM-dependent methyltransferase [Candidatus Pacebacteria bacterium]|nr:SAM-dependent methyltransferase [Candidatus Paceibacterota bacterium]
MVSTGALIILAILALSVFLWPTYIMLADLMGAPYVPVEPEVVKRILELAEVKKGEVFYDLGSGDGRVVIGAALKGARAYGVEIDPFRAWYSRFWLKLLRLKQARIIRKDFFDVDLSKADVVCFFLLPETNRKLEKKLRRELKKGARVVSVSFPVPGWRPVAVDPRGPIYGPIRLYQV